MLSNIWIKFYLFSEMIVIPTHESNQFIIKGLPRFGFSFLDRKLFFFF